MKEDYKWNYTIKIKTKDGTYEYEKEDLSNLDLLLEKHPGYEEIEAAHKQAEKTKKVDEKKMNEFAIGFLMAVILMCIVHSSKDDK